MKCPFCAGEIQDKAIKCPFCGEFIAEPGILNPESREQISQNKRTTAFAVKPETQIRIGLITVIFVLACLTLALITELCVGSLMSVSFGIIITCIFIVYLQGVLKKDIQIARRAYRTYFVIWLFSSVFALFDILDKRIGSTGTLVWLIPLGLSALTLFFLKIGINGLMQHPEAKNKSEKVKLLWWAFLPFIIVVLRIIIWIISPLFPPFFRFIMNLD